MAASPHPGGREHLLLPHDPKDISASRSLASVEKEEKRIQGSSSPSSVSAAPLGLRGAGLRAALHADGAGEDRAPQPRVSGTGPPGSAQGLGGQRMRGARTQERDLRAARAR